MTAIALATKQLRSPRNWSRRSSPGSTAPAFRSARLSFATSSAGTSTETDRCSTRSTSSNAKG